MLKTDLLISEDAVRAIADDWRQLQTAVGTTPFTDFDWFSVWLQHLGLASGKTPHVITVRMQGRLVGLLPLVVAHRKGMRILQGMAKDAFFPCDILVESPDCISLLWDAARQSPFYDFAAIGYVDCGSLSALSLDRFAKKRDTENAPYIDILWPTGEAWMESLSRQTRREHRRHLRRLEEKGDVSFHIHTGDKDVMPLIDGMLKHKIAWSIERDKTGLYNQRGVIDFFHAWADLTIKTRQFVFITLHINGIAIGYNLMFTCGKRVESYLITYDPAWARFSAGNLVQTHAIVWAIEQGFREFNFMQGETQSKLLFANAARTYAEYTFHASWCGGIKGAVFLALRGLKQSMHKPRKPPRKMASTKTAILKSEDQTAQDDAAVSHNLKSSEEE